MIRTIRRLLKPVALWLNALRFKRSEQHIEHLNWLREGAVRQLRYERAHQVELIERRGRISKW